MLSLFVAGSLRAEWGEEVREIRFEQSRASFQNPYVATLWGAIRSFSRRTFSIDSQTLHLRHPDFRATIKSNKKGLPITIALQKDRLGVVQKRPLVFFIPGFAGNHFGHWALSAIRRYYGAGNHVVVLPNPVSLDWVSLDYHAIPGDSVAESKTILDVMKAMRSYIGESHISQIHMAGESYGAFLTAMVAALDVSGESSNALLNKERSRIILESPPVDFLATLKNIDSRLDATELLYFNQCGSVSLKISVGLAQLFSLHKNKIDSTSDLCAESLVLHEGFRIKFFEILKSYYQHQNPGASSFDGYSLQDWKNHLRFLTFFRKHNPQAASLLANAAYRNLGFWLSRVRAKSHVSIQVVSAMDDFINSTSAWIDNSFFNFDESHLLLVDWGGHMGFQGSQQYEGLLKSVFRK